MAQLEMDNEDSGKYVKRDNFLFEPSVKNFIGEGYFGEVYKAVWMGVKVAAKRLRRRMFHDGIFWDSIMPLMQLHHPHIIQLYGVFIDEESPERPPVVIMELLHNTLRMRLIMHGKLNLIEAVEYSLQIGSALYYLHSQSKPVIHGNLTSNSIMLTSDNVCKLTDICPVNIVPDFHPAFPHQMLGDHPNPIQRYLPVEYLMDVTEYNEWHDVFCYAVVMLEMLTGLPPRPSGNVIETPSGRPTGIPETTRRAADLACLESNNPLKVFIISLLQPQDVMPSAADVYKRLMDLRNSEAFIQEVFDDAQPVSEESRLQRSFPEQMSETKPELREDVTPCSFQLVSSTEMQSPKSETEVFLTVTGNDDIEQTQRCRRESRDRPLLVPRYLVPPLSVDSAVSSFDSSVEGGPSPESMDQTVLEVFENDMPYTSVHLPSTLIGEDGARLSAGGVTVVYPPDVLPVGTPIEMMVAELAEGFKIDNRYSISPQVTLTAHGTLRVPLELTLPLRVSSGDNVSVRKSETLCSQPLSWKELARSDFSIEGDSVVVRTRHSTIYQALSGADDLYKINIVGDYVYFSLQQKPLAMGAQKRLCLRFSDQKGTCAEVKENFMPVEAVEEVYIRNPPCLDLQVQLEAINESIIQRTSACSLPTVNHPLEETFFIRTARPQGNAGSAIPGLAYFWRFLSVNEVSPRQASKRDFSWLVESASTHPIFGLGRVAILLGKVTDAQQGTYRRGHAVPLNDTMVFEQINDPGAAMQFSLTWTQVGAEDQPHPVEGQQMSQDRWKCHESASASGGNGTTQEAWRRAKMTDSDIQSRLFTELCDPSRPFCYRWKDVLRQLPAVSATLSGGGEAPRHVAFPGADYEIKNIIQSIKHEHGENVESECLRRTLTKWIECSTGELTVAHLLHVLSNIGLGGAGERFFTEFFTD